jgi:hypothetical protein
MIRHALFFPLALLLAAPIAAQTDQTDSPRVIRTTTLLFGVGNSLGQFGLEAERYFAGGRASFFGGLGYSPRFDQSWSGVSLAAGARVFTAGDTHRLFLEASVSQLFVETQPVGSSLVGDERVYGPGVQAGYQFVKKNGLTAMVSGGVGHTVGGPPHLQGTALLLGFGLGYTWMRR